MSKNATTKVGGTTKPSTQDNAAKKSGKSKRSEFKADGPLEVAVPEGYDFATNKPIKRKDFAKDALFFSHKAAELRYKADLMDEKAVEAGKTGSAKDRAAARRLQKMASKMAELRKQLEEQGVDVDDLLASAAE